MARSRRPDSPSLFDLPLESPASGGDEPVSSSVTDWQEDAVFDTLLEEKPVATSTPPATARRKKAVEPREARPEAEETALPRQMELGPAPFDEPATAQEPASQRLPAPETEPEPGSMAKRIFAGLADLMLHCAVALILLAGAALLGVRPDLTKLLPLGLFLLVFSFLYGTVALAFWGATPGMAWRRLSTHGSDGEALSFPQATRRWLGGLLTLILVGLPLLPLLWGARALSDRLSGSVTVRQRF